MLRLFFVLPCAALMIAVAGTTGCATSRQLIDNDYAMSLHVNEAKNIHESKLIPIDFIPSQYGFARMRLSPSDVVETNILVASVIEMNLFGESVPVGWFDGGSLVNNEVAGVVERNFALPPIMVSSVAELSYMIERIGLRKVNDDVVSSIEVRIKICRVGRLDEIAFEKSYSASKRRLWSNANCVPESFYDAMNEVLNKFVADIADSRIMPILKQWNSDINIPTVPHPSITINPDIVSWNFEPRKDQNQMDLWCGNCVAKCNDYDAARAASWAHATIWNRCKDMLGKQGIEPERIRLVYDSEELENGCWRYEFHAFPRNKVPVLDYYKKKGCITGDMRYMGKPLDEALEELKAIVQAEMDKQIAPGGGVKGAASVHYSPFKYDRAYELLSISFTLD